MKLIGDRYGVAESVDDSRKTALDLIAAHPDLKGFLAFGSQGPIGAARAVEEKGLVGKVFVVGSFSPGQGRKLLKEGAITGRVHVESGRGWPRGHRPRRQNVGQADRTIKDGHDRGPRRVHPDPKTQNIITDNLDADQQGYGRQARRSRA